MVEYLSMPDPCPHISRIDIMRERLGGGENLDSMLDHIAQCEKENNGKPNA